MEDLNSFKEKLEANLLTLNKFEGLENDLIQQHGNLRSQFSEYREAIEAANLSEKEKREHYGHHDELVKKLHKLILEAKALARKRTEQMTRDELFKLSQERQKPQSAEDKIGEEVTKSLKRMLETMRSEVERSSSNISTARETTKNLQGTTENYEKLSGTLEESRSLIRDLWKKNRNDMIYIIGALGVFMATAVYVILQRTPGIVWLPGKMVLRQIGNMIPKSSERTGKFVERVVEMTEAVLSDSEDAPDMFVDRILSKEEYGNDDLLKQEEEKEGDTAPVIIERAEPEVESDRENSLISSDDQESTISETGISTSNSVETITAESAQISTTQATEVKDNHLHKTPVEVSTQKVTESVDAIRVAENHVEFIEKTEILNEIVENTQKLDSHEISVINTAINDSATVEEPTKVGESLIVNETTLNNEAPDSVPVQVEEPLVATAISQNDNPNTLTPINAEIVTESAYYTTTESEFEGNQAIYSSDTELFSGIEGNMDL